MTINIDRDKYKIKISDDVLKVINKYRQIALEDYEAGGILIGYITIDNNIIIEYATEPYDNDKRKRFKFKRIDPKHGKILNDLWNERGEHIYTYLGEWHTHPENIPSYSILDRLNWINLAQKTIPKKEILVNIIGGIEKSCVWEYHSLNRQIIKIAEIGVEDDF